MLANIGRAPLKPDQRLTLLQQHLIPKIMYGLQNPRITGKALRDADRLIKARAKGFLHLSSHTPDPYLYSAVKDGGLGLTELREEVPRVLLARLVRLSEVDGDAVLNGVMQSSTVSTLMFRSLAGGPMSAGLERCVEDPASREWLFNKPRGWTGKDFVRAVQLRTNNLATAGLVYNSPEQRMCRAGCARSETISHVLQGCPATHWERIRRHNTVAKRLAQHCSRRWQVEEEPHVRHQRGVLFKPDLAIHIENTEVVCDVQVAWEGRISLDQAWDNKRLVYDNLVFREAAAARWPGKTFKFLPLIIGARGVWPRCNGATVEALSINRQLKSSLVATVVKRGGSIHSAFRNPAAEP